MNKKWAADFEKGYEIHSYFYKFFGTFQSFVTPWFTTNVYIFDVHIKCTHDSLASKIQDRHEYIDHLQISKRFQEYGQ